MQQPIMIMCHWHTGSRMLGRLLHKAGMEVGNKYCGFVDRAPGQEHPEMSSITSKVYLKDLARISDNIDYSKLKQRFWDILQSYNTQARIKNWKFYGIKNNFLCDKKVWEVFSPILFDCWPNVKIVISIRHPLDIYRTANNPEWSMQDVASSFIRTHDVINDLVEVQKKALLVVHPYSFLSLGKIKRLVDFVGMKWEDGIERVFDFNKVKNIATLAEKMGYSTIHRRASDCYVRLSNMRGDE